MKVGKLFGELTRPEMKNWAALVMTEEGLRKWSKESDLTILDIKPEFRKVYASNFIQRR